MPAPQRVAGPAVIEAAGLAVEEAGGDVAVAARVRRAGRWCGSLWQPEQSAARSGRKAGSMRLRSGCGVPVLTPWHFSHVTSRDCPVSG